MPVITSVCIFLAESAPHFLSAQIGPPTPFNRPSIPQEEFQESVQEAEPSAERVYLPERAEAVLDFWFGYLPNPDYFPEYKVPLWFAETPEIQSRLRQLFSRDVLKARKGEYNYWREDPRARLALVLLLDQIPRHIYRNRPQAFASDPMARGLVLEAMQEGQDERLYPIERAFFYLPLEHAEDPALQRISVEAYRRLLIESPWNLKPLMQEFYDYALAHQRQIEKFGRFPARHSVLNREPTSHEKELLKQSDDKQNILNETL